MKRLFSFITVFGLLFCGMHSAFAQEPDNSVFRPDGPRPERPERPERKKSNPAEVAKKTVDQLNTVVGLNDDQYKKLYKFHLSLEKSRQAEQENMGFPGGRPGMGGPGGRPDGGPGGPGMGGPGGPGGFSGGGPGGNGGPGGGRPQMSEERREMIREMKEERRAAEEALQQKIEKKYRKILTPEQFEKWESYEAEQAIQRELRRKAARSQRPGADTPGRPDNVTPPDSANLPEL